MAPQPQHAPPTCPSSRIPHSRESENGSQEERKMKFAMWTVILEMESSIHDEGEHTSIHLPVCIRSMRKRKENALGSEQF